MSLKDKAMLVGLTIKTWIARKYDQAISIEISEMHAKTNDAGRFNKHLLPGKAESYEAVLKKGREMRTFYYDNTLPWSKEGHRILPAANYQDFAEGIRKFKREFSILVDDFLREYPLLKEDARVLLNGMYRESDYPSVEEMTDKFGVEIEVMPLPDADDFRVAIADLEIENIRTEISTRMKREFDAANHDLWMRLRVAVGNMVGRLDDPNGIFRDSLVDNLRDIVELVPKLNVTGDARLNEVAEVCANTLAVHEPQTLRDNLTVRSQVASQAKEIAQIMDAYM